MKFLFLVLLSNKAEKQLKDIEKKMRKRIEELFEVLENAPVPAKEYDIRKIRGEANAYRIRLSRFRITYVVFWKDKAVRISKVEMRSESTYD